MMMMIILPVKITIGTIIDGYYEPSSLVRALYMLSYLVLKTRRPYYDHCTEEEKVSNLTKVSQSVSFTSRIQTQAF